MQTSPDSLLQKYSCILTTHWSDCSLSLSLSVLIFPLLHLRTPTSRQISMGPCSHYPDVCIQPKTRPKAAKTGSIFHLESSRVQKHISEWTLMLHRSCWIWNCLHGMWVITAVLHLAKQGDNRHPNHKVTYLITSSDVAWYNHTYKYILNWTERTNEYVHLFMKCFFQYSCHSGQWHKWQRVDIECAKSLQAKKCWIILHRHLHRFQLFWKLSEINVRCKQEQSTEYTEEVKRLQDSCIVFRRIDFNQSDLTDLLCLYLLQQLTSQCPRGPFCLSA